jgi:hypothetical protein
MQQDFLVTSDNIEMKLSHSINLGEFLLNH